MIAGMDFGTTNSGMAVYDGKKVQLLPLDPANSNPHVARTALYLTNDQEVVIGREALDLYFEQNVGRPVSMQKVWVGEVEVYGADMYFVTDVYAWTDSLSPGRLFLSIKSGLRDPEYQGTVVGQFHYSLENLVATYLSLVKLRAERVLGRQLNEVVLGRPVRFSTDPQADALAQRRLLEAAFRAGYKKIYLQYEPIAAAYHYARTINKPENILVFDFGGGTLDITIMHLDGKEGREVLATGGIPIAGDVFDHKLVRAKMPRHFGEGSRYGAEGRELPLPKWIFDVFSNWQTIIELQTPESRKLMREIAETAQDRRGVEALISLVTNNYGLQMFDVAEAAKRKLSSDMGAIMRLKGPGFDVTEMVTRSEFDRIIRAEILSIDKHLDETLVASGLSANDIDAVIRTGGSSEIPAFRFMLMSKFGRDKILATDTFSSVTSGLGIIAHGIAEGTIKAEAHTPDGQPKHSDAPYWRNVTPVNLPLLQRRMAAQEDDTIEKDVERRVALLLLATGNQLKVSALPAGHLNRTGPLDLGEAWSPGDAQLQTALLASLDETLLLVTSRYRFLLTTPGHLLDLKELEMGVVDFFQFAAHEHITTIGRWSEIKTGSKLLLVTTRGFARAYDMVGLIELIEGPAPYRFSEPLNGLPAAVFGAGEDDALMIALDNSRAVRYPIDAFPIRGLQAVKWQEGERVAGATLVKADEEVMLVNDDGYGRRLPAQWVGVPSKPNSRGRMLVARRQVVGMENVASAAQFWAITARNLHPIDPEKLSLDRPNSTKSYRLMKLGPNEKVQGLLKNQTNVL